MIGISEAIAGLTFSGHHGGDAIPDGTLVADAVVLMRLVDADTGEESMCIAVSDGCGGITRVGLVAHGMAALNRVAPEDD